MILELTLDNFKSFVGSGECSGPGSESKAVPQKMYEL
jgi:hypothetical protein